MEPSPRVAAAGGHRRRSTAPAQVLWDVVRRISTGQRTLPDTEFVIDESTGITDFGVGYEWLETRHGRTDRFRVTRHEDRAANGGIYEVLVVVGGELRRQGTRVTVTQDGSGSQLRFDALLAAPNPFARAFVVLTRPFQLPFVRRAFGPIMERIIATAEREAG